MNTLNYSLIWIEAGASLLAFIAAITLSKKDKPYMKGFFYCTVIGFLLSLNNICSSLYQYYGQPVYRSADAILLMADIIFWYLFFNRILKVPENKQLLKSFFQSAAFIAIVFAAVFFNSETYLQVSIVTNGCKVAFCFIFYHELFKKLSIQNILTEPSFWIICGLVFFSCLTVLINLIASFTYHKFSPTIYNGLFSLLDIVAIIMYIFFIKALITWPKPVKPEEPVPQIPKRKPIF